MQNANSFRKFIYSDQNSPFFPSRCLSPATAHTPGQLGECLDLLSVWTNFGIISVKQTSPVAARRLHPTAAFPHNIPRDSDKHSELLHGSDLCSERFSFLTSDEVSAKSSAGPDLSESSLQTTHTNTPLLCFMSVGNFLSLTPTCNYKEVELRHKQERCRVSARRWKLCIQRCNIGVRAHSGPEILTYLTLCCSLVVAQRCCTDYRMPQRVKLIRYRETETKTHSVVGFKLLSSFCTRSHHFEFSTAWWFMTFHICGDVD